MGLVGFVLKNLSAIVGPFGYALKGVVKQAERSKGPHKLIRRARIAQGQREARLLDEDERHRLGKEVVEGWHVLKDLGEEISSGVGQRGLAGQIDKVRLDTAVLFEDVETARRSLQALKKGETLEHLVHPEREPRMSATESKGHAQEADSGELPTAQRHRSSVGSGPESGLDKLRPVRSLA